MEIGETNSKKHIKLSSALRIRWGATLGVQRHPMAECAAPHRTLPAEHEATLHLPQVASRLPPLPPDGEGPAQA